jgi:predicted butyrate kinase (DUF1464 family)
MIVLVNLKENVASVRTLPELDERHVPAVLELRSVDEWRDHRVGSLAEAGGEPPYEYIVTIEINNLEQLGRDMESEKVHTLLVELGRYAEVTQLMTERFV